MRWNRTFAGYRGTLLAMLAAPILLAAPLRLPAQAPSRPLIVELPLHDTIQPISAAYLRRGLNHAAQVHAQAVVVALGTPGGLLDSTRAIVTSIEQSKVPVIVYVAPSGSRAASAGFFILESADVAAMAPGTNTGASHPILEGQRMDPVLKLKIENDAAAFLRSYVSRRGRNVQAAEDAVRNSKSYTDEEALNLHLIDTVSPNVSDLLDHLNGTSIARFDGSKQTLRTGDADVEVMAPSTRERILAALTDPNLAVILLVLGGLLIYLEFNAPGTIVPGALGTLLVLISLFALNLLPLQYTAVGFLVAAAVLFVLDVKFATHGMLGLAGIACLVFGLLTLVDGPIPEMQVHLETALGAGIGFGLITVFLTAIAVRARRNKVQTGNSALLGTLAIAQSPLDPDGQVMVRGELWQARSRTPVQTGEAVRILSREGLLLHVERDQQDS
ncbi:MAG TPA: nodulation protein NfeD [Acidobacteriaceae bacterium]|nr:nodulation protein NfeD [Acidobacteriaceae bacterium]